MHKVLFLILSLSAASLCIGAETYPSRPVRVIVGAGTGGGTDIASRLISQQLSEQLGKSFAVENRPGAGSTIGASFVAKSAPDGYTLAMADPSWTTVSGLYKSLPYDVARDFVGITQLIRVPNVLVVRASPGISTLKEFIALAQQYPGKLNFGSSGLGGINHLAPELFKKAARVNIVHVAYKGGGETITGLLGDEVQMVIAPVLSVLPFVQSGKMRALAVTTDGKRIPSLPDVPSMSESGIAGMDVYYWAGLVGPYGMSREVVTLLQAEVVRALAVPAVREKFIAQSAEVVAGSSEAFSAHIRSEIQRWGEIIKLAGIIPE